MTSFILIFYFFASTFYHFRSSFSSFSPRALDLYPVCQDIHGVARLWHRDIVLGLWRERVETWIVRRLIGDIAFRLVSRRLDVGYGDMPEVFVGNGGLYVVC